MAEQVDSHGYIVIWKSFDEGKWSAMHQYYDNLKDAEDYFYGLTVNIGRFISQGRLLKIGFDGSRLLGKHICWMTVNNDEEEEKNVDSTQNTKKRKRKHKSSKRKHKRKKIIKLKK